MPLGRTTPILPYRNHVAGMLCKPVSTPVTDSNLVICLPAQLGKVTDPPLKPQQSTDVRTKQYQIK